MANNYQAGNLELSMSAFGDDKVLSSLDITIARLTKLSQVLKSITTADFKWLSSFSTRLNNLGKKMDNMNFSTIENGFNRLSKAVAPFLTMVGQAESSLKSLSEVMNKASGKKFMKMTSSTGGLGDLFKLGKISSTIYLARRLAKSFAQILQYGSEFTETLNMWQVSMRNSLDLADDFVNKMHRAYGISTETLMRNQAIYKNMLSQMGQLTEETSYQLSESLTQMMLDYSSLWNVTIDQASEKFKAMLAGQIRPIRAVSGISVEEQAIYDIYRGMGGTKTMRQLTQTEKRLLRIYATFSQMQQSGATGDFAKTLEQFANQSRLMSEYWKELITWVGIGLKELIQASGIMQYFNAGLIVATEIVKALVKSAGYETPDFLDGFLESTDDANDAMDELKGKLLDFDKFRALEDTSGLGNVAIDEKVIELINSYRSSLDDVVNKSQELAEIWLKGLGFKEVNGELTITDENLKNIETTLKIIGISLASIVGYNIVLGIGKMVTALFSLNNILLVTKTAFFGILSSSLFQLFDNLLSNLDKSERKIKSWATAIVGAIVAIIVAITAAQKAPLAGVTGAIIGAEGAGLLVAGLKNLIWQEYANGGMPDTGTLFVAGEAGAEIVSTSTSGKTGVANVDQIAQATYKGQIMAWQQIRRDLKDFGGVEISADAEGIFRVVRKSAKSQGLDFVAVK